MIGGLIRFDRSIQYHGEYFIARGYHPIHSARYIHSTIHLPIVVIVQKKKKTYNERARRVQLTATRGLRAWSSRQGSCRYLLNVQVPITADVDFLHHILISFARMSHMIWSNFCHSTLMIYLRIRKTIELLRGTFILLYHPLKHLT